MGIDGADIKKRNSKKGMLTTPENIQYPLKQSGSSKDKLRLFVVFIILPVLFGASLIRYTSDHKIAPAKTQTLTQQRHRPVISDQELWVMQNVYTGVPWDHKLYTEKLGPYSEIPIKKGNPKILKNYYFHQPDLTFLVNVYNNRIDTWTPGRDGDRKSGN